VTPPSIEIKRSRVTKIVFLHFANCQLLSPRNKDRGFLLPIAQLHISLCLLQDLQSDAAGRSRTGGATAGLPTPSAGAGLGGWRGGAAAETCCSLQPLVLACIHQSIRFGYFSGIFLLKVLEHFLTAPWFVVFDLSLQRSPRTSYPTSLALTASPSTWISRSAPAPARRRSMIRTAAVSYSDDLARPRLHRGQPLSNPTSVLS